MELLAKLVISILSKSLSMFLIINVLVNGKAMETHLSPPNPSFNSDSFLRNPPDSLRSTQDLSKSRTPTSISAAASDVECFVPVLSPKSRREASKSQRLNSTANSDLVAAQPLSQLEDFPPLSAVNSNPSAVISGRRVLQVTNPAAKSTTSQMCAHPSMEQSTELGLEQNGSKCYDDDGRLKRTGTVWTASAHIITAVIGSGVLSLSWAIAQLGWVAGPSVMILFAFVIYYTSNLLSDCYRSGDPVTGKRNYTYMDAVHANFGRVQVQICGWFQYTGLFGIAVGYTIAASTSMLAIQRSNCFHENGGESPCRMSSNPYMILFGVVEIFISQIPDFDQISWLSAIAAVMSFTYSFIGLILGIMQVASNGVVKGSLTGISVGTVSEMDKIWRSLQAFGDIAFAYSYSIILIEIQDTLRASPKSESKVMRKATLFSIGVTTTFYMLCGCMGYAAFGDSAQGNLLTGFGFYNPYWLLDIANAAVVIHLVGAYQVFCQPLFAFVEKSAQELFPNSNFINKDIYMSISSTKSYRINLFRLTWRTIFVVVTTVISMLLPFFNDVVGFLGAVGFWPLTVYFPVGMYINQMKVGKWSGKWICLHTMSVACLIVSLAAAVGSIAGILSDLKIYKPFKTNY